MSFASVINVQLKNMDLQIKLSLEKNIFNLLNFSFKVKFTKNKINFIQHPSN